MTVELFDEWSDNADNTANLSDVLSEGMDVLVPWLGWHRRRSHMLCACGSDQQNVLIEHCDFKLALVLPWNGLSAQALRAKLTTAVKRNDRLPPCLALAVAAGLRRMLVLLMVLEAKAQETCHVAARPRSSKHQSLFVRSSRLCFKKHKDGMKSHLLRPNMLA